MNTQRIKLTFEGDLNATRKLVLLALVYRAGRTSQAEAPMKGLISDTGLTADVIKSALKRLEKDGWITGQRARGLATCYTLSFGEPGPDCDVVGLTQAARDGKLDWEVRPVLAPVESELPQSTLYNPPPPAKPFDFGRRFVPPSRQEWAAFCQSVPAPVAIRAFNDHQAAGWHGVTNWRAAAMRLIPR